MPEGKKKPRPTKRSKDDQLGAGRCAYGVDRDTAVDLLLECRKRAGNSKGDEVAWLPLTSLAALFAVRFARAAFAPDSFRVVLVEMGSESDGEPRQSPWLNNVPRFAGT